MRFISYTSLVSLSFFFLSTLTYVGSIVFCRFMCVHTCGSQVSFPACLIFLPAPHMLLIWVYICFCSHILPRMFPHCLVPLHATGVISHIILILICPLMLFYVPYILSPPFLFTYDLICFHRLLNASSVFCISQSMHTVYLWTCARVWCLFIVSQFGLVGYMAAYHFLQVAFYLWLCFYCANLFWLTDKALSLGFNRTAEDFPTR